MYNIQTFAKLKVNRKAVSPAIATVVLTSAIVVLLLVTIVFANNFLEARMTENEFSAMKQFMQTVGLQIDDVAWIPGRTQTIRYASRYGQVSLVKDALSYDVYVDDVLLAEFNTSIILFNIPVSKYTVGNNYHERISSTNSFLNEGASASSSYVFVVEKLPMADGNFIRIVVVPCIRMLNTTVGGTSYIKLYLPKLVSSGNHPRLSQSITLAGESVSVKTKSGGDLRIRLTFPKAGEGFSSEFFSFSSDEESTSISGIVEFYTGDVNVTLGMHG